MPGSNLPEFQSPSSATSVAPERLARLIAIGRESFPLELPEDELQQIKGLVRRYRCQRLMTLIAQVLAADITFNRPMAEESDSP